MKVLACALGAFALALAAPALAQQAQSAPSSPSASPAGGVEGVGVVRAVNAKAATITIDHEAIPSLGWPAMTMTFKVADPALLQGIARGARVRFRLQGQSVVALSVF